MIELEWNHLTNMCFWINATLTYQIFMTAKNIYNVEKKIYEIDNKKSHPSFKKSLKSLLFSDIN